MCRSIFARASSLRWSEGLALDQRKKPRHKAGMTPEQFKIVRKLAGFSQEGVAREWDMSTSAIQRIESGRRGDPIPEKYRRLILTLKGK